MSETPRNFDQVHKLDAPRFSVTIPAYNAESTLAETVASVQAQTFADFEVVICNDGSTDGTLALAHSLASGDPRIRVVSQENRGSGGAYNTAVRNARSEFVVMLSADDLLLPEHLASFDEFVRDHPDAAIFSCDGFILYDDGRRVPQDLNRFWADKGTMTLEDLLQACLFDIGAVYRREVFDAVGGFREDLFAEDFLFFLLAVARGFQHCYLERKLAVHRRNRTQKSADAIRVREADVRTIEILIETGLLGDSELATARRVIEHHKRNIRIRRMLAAMLGQERSARLIERLRGRSV